MKIILRNLFFTVVLILVAHYLKAEQAKIPETIIRKLDEAFPGHNTINWNKSHRTYQANFIYNNRNVSITYDQDAQVVNFVNEIDISSLPEMIREKINASFSTYKILLIEKVQKKNRTFYHIEIIQGELHYVLAYTEKGYLQHYYHVRKDDLDDFIPD
jgi:hypothetical protein